MLVSLWSAKGGTGVSVTAALVALRASRRDPQGVLLVDVAGDQPLVLGAPRGEPDGLTTWLGDHGRSPAALTARAVEVGQGLGLLCRGRGEWPAAIAIDDAINVLADHPATVVVDAGCVIGDGPSAEVARQFAAASTRSVLVTRPCYLAVARARDLPVAPSSVVLLREPHRALAAIDVELAVGAAVAATIDVDPSIARIVDAGLLTGRSPRGLDRVLDAVA